MLEWDKTLKVGDIITGYRKGIHRILKITPRTQIGGGLKLDGLTFGSVPLPPIVTYQTCLNGSYKKAGNVAGRKFHCCASFCQKITMDIAIKLFSDENVETIAKFKRLYAFLEEHK